MNLALTLLTTARSELARERGQRNDGNWIGAKLPAISSCVDTSEANPQASANTSSPLLDRRDAREVLGLLAGNPFDVAADARLLSHEQRTIREHSVAGGS